MSKGQFEKILNDLEVPDFSPKRYFRKLRDKIANRNTQFSNHVVWGYKVRFFFFRYTGRIQYSNTIFFPIKKLQRKPKYE